MALVWLITLVIYGCVAGWDIPVLNWWLLVPMVSQDLANGLKNK